MIKAKLRSVAYIAKRHSLRIYSFATRDSTWAVAVRGGLIFMAPVAPHYIAQSSLIDIRHPSAEKDYHIFASLAHIGQKQSGRYQLVFSGTLQHAINAYPPILLARSGTHIYSPRWRSIAEQHARYMHRPTPPCTQIAEDVLNASLMVRLNYRLAGSFYIFLEGIPADYAYPIYEDCKPMQHARERTFLKSSAVVPYTARMPRTTVVPAPTPPPTIDQISSAHTP